MKSTCVRRVAIGLSGLVWAAAVLAQEAGVAGPAWTTLRGHRYPQIGADLRGTFRISAPGAGQVFLSLSGRREMSKDAEGVWTITTGPLPPGFHYYSFMVDGVSLADPASESYFGMGRMVSGIEVPSRGEDFYEAKEVAHGEVRERSWVTRSAREVRKVVVYTPPDYDRDSGSRYPVLYLQHGYGEDRRAWWRQGRVNFILDNLLAAGVAKPMIVVMEDGGIATGLGGGGRPPVGDRLAFAEAFEKVMIDELIPMIDGAYRTIADREHRAIAGTSLGGWQAIQIGLRHLEAFGFIGGFSPGLPPEVSRIAGDAAGFNEKVRVFFLGTGTVEREANPNIRDLHEALDKAGVRHVYYESPGTAHEWLTWRRDLRQFAPLLFQE